MRRAGFTEQCLLDSAFWSPLNNVPLGGCLAGSCPSLSLSQQDSPGILLPFVSLEVAVGGGCGFHPFG